MDSPTFHVRLRPELGPISREQLQELAAREYLQPTDQVRRDSGSEWLPAARIPGLFGAAESPVVVAPPTVPPGVDSGEATRTLSESQAAERTLDQDIGVETPATLAVQAGSDRSTDSPATADPGATLTYPPGTLAEDKRMLGMPDFEVMDELGRGGMGVVYKARQVSLNRTVAVKMLLAGAHASAQMEQRFRNEAAAVARLQHANFVQIFQVGEHQGKTFIVFEFVDGPSLERQLSQAPLAPRAAASLLRQLALAMQLAHEHGIVHRDLKPSNVLMCSDGTPKISDFGLAKRLDETAGQTRSGAVLGTPSYMAPEQAEGKSPIGPAADVYALGAILYEMLTGRPPFRADTPLNTIRQVIGDEAAPPSRLQSGVPRDLETICLKCLEKAPSRRYTSARALADDLGRFLGGEPIVARAARRIEIAAKWARRKPVLAALWLVSVSSLLLFLTLGTLVALRLKSERDNAQFQEGQAVEERNKARAQEKLALKERNRAQEQERLAQRQTALAYLGRADGSFESREYSSGLLWLARSLETMPDGYPEDQQAIRRSLASWSREIIPVQAVFPEPSGVLTRNRDRTLCAIGAMHAPGPEQDASEGNPIRVSFRNAAYEVVGGSFVVDEEGLLDYRFIGNGRHLALLVDEQNAAVKPPPAPPVKGGANPTPPVPRKDPDADPPVNILLKIWSVDQKKWTVTKKLLGGPHRMAFLGPDGRTVLAMQENGILHLLDVESQKLICPPFAGQVQFGKYPFSPDGKMVVCLAEAEKDAPADPSRAVEAQLRDTATGKPIGPARKMGAFAFSPDSKLLALAGADAIELWSLSDAALQASIQVPDNLFPSQNLAFSANGQLLTARLGSATGAWRIGPRGWQLIARFEDADDIGVSADERFIVTVSYRGVTQVWDARNGQPVGAAIAEQPMVSNDPFGPTGTELWTTDLHSTKLRLLSGARQLGHPAEEIVRGGIVAVHPTRPVAAVWEEEGVFAPQGSLLFSPDGKYLVIVDKGNVRSIEVGTGKKQEFQLPLAEGTSLSASFGSGNSRRLILVAPTSLGFVEGYDLEVTCWDVATGKQLGGKVQCRETDQAIAVSPDGAVIVPTIMRLVGEVATQRQETQLRELATGKVIGKPLYHKGNIVSVAFSDDSRWVATGSIDETARLWDARSGEPLGGPLPHHGRLAQVQFTPDSKLLVTCTEDGTWRTWDVQTQRPLLLPVRVPQRRPFDKPSAAISPDGKLLAQASSQGVLLWDLATGLRVGPILQKRWDGAPAFSADGRWLILRNQGYGPVSAWELSGTAAGSPDLVRRRAETRSGFELDDSGALHSLTAAEWQARLARIPLAAQPPPAPLNWWQIDSKLATWPPPLARPVPAEELGPLDEAVPAPLPPPPMPSKIMPREPVSPVKNRKPSVEKH